MCKIKYDSSLHQSCDSLLPPYWIVAFFLSVVGDILLCFLVTSWPDCMICRWPGNNLAPPPPVELSNPGCHSSRVAAVAKKLSTACFLGATVASRKHSKSSWTQSHSWLCEEKRKTWHNVTTAWLVCWRKRIRSLNFDIRHRDNYFLS